jgi:hypothetical protein
VSEHKNLIAGDWVAGTRAQRNINPSDTHDVVGEYAQADAAQAKQAIDAAHAAFPKWAAATPQQRFDALDFIGSEILARKAELGDLLAREEGKTLPEGHRRGHARRPHLQVLRGRDAAHRRRAAAVRAARHRRRGHARAAGRRVDHHAVELPDRDPGVEDRARRSRTAIASCSSRPTSCRAARGRSRDREPQRDARRRAQPRDGTRARSSATC